MPRPMKAVPTITQAEAARMLDIARQNVPAAIVRGELVAVLDPRGGPVRVTLASAKRAAKARQYLP